MKNQIPDDDQERLDILNQWFTEILCSRGYFDDDKWLPIRLNILKWSQRGYSFRHLNTSNAQDFTVIESAKVYRIYNMLSEIDMFSLAIKEVAKSQKFEQAALYMKLIVEEYKELMHAWNETDIIEIADACADLKWVIEGLEHSLGIPQQAVWDEVARSNMSKMVDGKLIKREDGKVLKPDTFVPPNIKQILES